jgi:oligosaccharyltransferase complex subunit alpha (ribophorin I)
VLGFGEGLWKEVCVLIDEVVWMVEVDGVEDDVMDGVLQVDLLTQVVRLSTAWKVENAGAEPATEIQLALSTAQVERLAFMEIVVKGKGKNAPGVFVSESDVSKQGSVTLFTFPLPKALKQGEVVSFESYVALVHQLKPFPEEISQADVQLVTYDDSAYILSPYPIKVQTSIFQLSSSRLESFTKVAPTKVVDTEVRYGPYENVEALKSKPVALHFENNQPFAVAEELVREVEISHWGNVYVTEYYKLANKGARLKGSFSRFEYQARPGASGVSAFRHLLARLPVNAHSVYYRDEIGNISTSHLRSDFGRTELELEPRYPLFGSWKVAFTLGYSVPLQDLVFKAPDGSRYLNISFGSPFSHVVVDKLVLKVVLPEGSYDMSVSVPFAAEQLQEKKYSYLDTVGRKVAVLVKRNSILEHQFKFIQVHYRFNSLGMLVEPLMLVLAFFAFFASCIAYTHFDFTLSKTTAAYLAQVQREEVVDVLQRLQRVLAVRGAAEERLDASLKEVTRTGDIAACKAARKAADAVWKGTSKDLKVLTDSLQSAVKSVPGKTSLVKPSAIVTKVETLLQKEKELVEKLQQKQTVIVDAYERKLSNKEIDARIAPVQEKLESLRQEVSSLISSLDD